MIGHSFIARVCVWERVCLWQWSLIKTYIWNGVRKNRLIHYINTDLWHVIGLMRIVFERTHTHTALFPMSPNFSIYFVVFFFLSLCSNIYICCCFFVIVMMVVVVIAVVVVNTHLLLCSEVRKKRNELFRKRKLLERLLLLIEMTRKYGTEKSAKARPIQ